MPKDHALLSPSGASRWLECAPSARLESQFPDSAGEAAREGTLCHTLGETLLRFHTGRIKKAAYQKALKTIQNDPLYSPDMLEHAESYAAFVLEMFEDAKKGTPDAVLEIESKLDLTEYVPEAFGTGDAIIIADGVLDVIDLKYGKGVPVSCVKNKQMMLYALGALREFDFLYDIERVEMTVYQPRLDNISTWEISVSELRDWAENVLKPTAELAFKGEGEFRAGDHCRFCRAKAQCRALAEKNLQIAKYDFKSCDLLTNDEIADILLLTDDIKNWLGAVDTYALDAALKGVKFNGFKLVEGRSNRTYLDKEKVADTLFAEGFAETTIFEPKALKGITALEKAITKKVFTEVLSDLVIKPQGKPTLVLETDKRPEWNSSETARRDFAEAPDGELDDFN